MDIQRFTVTGIEYGADDPALQAALAKAHDAQERPRCLCVSGGVEMYIARHRQFVLKRMPGSGMRHHPECPSYEPDAQQSGLGELVGEAVLEPTPGSFELRVNFPWMRVAGRAVPKGEPQDPAEVVVARKRMSLRALMHFLFERAGLNRWTPAMQGKRNQGVLHKYLLEAAESVTVRGLSLSERLYVPEPFSEEGREGAASRRRAKLSVLHPRNGQSPLAIALGEFKACDTTALGCRVWIKHAPDAPLLADARTWGRIERTFGALLEARHADTNQRVRVVMAALIRARREHTYEIDAASMMLTSEHWIPLDGVHELDLLGELVAQRRRFLKPLRYDARTAAAFPNALLLDAGTKAVPLHVVSAFMSAKERAIKEKSAQAADGWIWRNDEPMPQLPVTHHPGGGRRDAAGRDGAGRT
ncbi:DUF1173 family protein [Pseudorhodoferax soli]|uniref:Uncharacterized protein DUF1173 n=1 Tax=Pseudorhodoferax soli TaxID=545864 RepID=A0A368XB00_9BURK|nr:DUF1173 family protein [Pseudorhodoferax soli]RCW65130.1 uncharacterized protein DUF1173 [Pseudorhodoferax soli]